jgi:hypothetical protein
VALLEEIDFYLLDTIPSSDLLFETLDFMDLGFEDLLCISESWELIWVWLKVTTFLLAEDMEFLLEVSDFPTSLVDVLDFLFVLIG